MRVGGFHPGGQALQVRLEPARTQRQIFHLGLDPQEFIADESQRGIRGEVEALVRVAQEQAAHGQLASGLEAPQVFLHQRGEAGVQAYLGIQLSAHADALLQGEGLCQGGEVHGRFGMEVDDGISQQVGHLGIGQDVGVYALELQDFQVGVGGLLAHQVHLSVEVGLEVVHPIGQAVIVGGDVVELDFQGGQRHLAFAIESFQGAFHQDFASGLDRFFLQHAFGNHVQHGFHGRCVQAIGQIHVESVCGGVAAEGAFHVQFRAVDVQAGVM